MGDQPRREKVGTVVACYSVIDKFLPTCGMLDYTEGIYYGKPDTPYEEAQQNQIHYVLDQVQCGPGTRVLDVGCGNGTLLDEIRRRGAVGVGVTISPEQVRLCRQRGLDARLINYRDIDEEWTGKFDAVVANGPMEHFVQPADAAAGKSDAIYREFFAIMHRVLDASSAIKRLINTTIYFVRQPDPADLLRDPDSFPKGSDSFHYALLARSFGGWYPNEGQFERCAAGLFQVTETVDGTQDYHFTSEQWLQRIRQALRSPKALTILAKSLPVAVRHPRQLATMLRCMLGTESWNWQFRGASPPTRLLRQTWRYC